MKKILIHSVGGKNNNLFDPNVRDNYNRPYIYLKQKLYELGYDLSTSDEHSIENVEYVFFHDYNSVNIYYGVNGKIKKILALFFNKFKSRDLYKEIQNTSIKKILFLWEASAVMPKNWESSLHNKFDKIMTWNDDYVDNIKFYKIYWPQTDVFPEIHEKSFNEKKLLVNISMNKSSNHKLELYSERLKTITYFNNNYSNIFDLFGYGWNNDNHLKGVKKKIFFKTYQGVIKNKWEVLPNYKFAICYENIKDTPGWVTEKIFDCFRCQCVPIYWGASNIYDFVPDGTFIDRRKFSSNEELANFIINMNEKDYKKYIYKINEYLHSDLFIKFLPANYANTIITQLNN